MFAPSKSVGYGSISTPGLSKCLRIQGRLGRLQRRREQRRALVVVPRPMRSSRRVDLDQ